MSMELFRLIRGPDGEVSVDLNPIFFYNYRPRDFKSQKKFEHPDDVMERIMKKLKIKI